MSNPRSILRPEGAACPECGRPIQRRASALTPGEVMMRCPSCGWFSCWRPSGPLPTIDSLEAMIDDLNWMAGAGSASAASHANGSALIEARFGSRSAAQDTAGARRFRTRIIRCDFSRFSR